MKTTTSKGKRKKTIRHQIMAGYQKMIIMMAVLTVMTLLSLYCVQSNYTLAARNQKNQSDIQTAIAGHYKWIDDLNNSILNGEEFEGSLDHNTCSFGAWKAQVSPKELRDEQIRAAMDAADGPHERIHTLAVNILELSKTDKDAALLQYENEIIPQTEEVIRQLDVINGRFQQKSQKASTDLLVLIAFSAVLTLLVTAVIIVIAVMYSKRLAIRISQPVVAIAEWAEKLSLGIEELEFDGAMLDENQDNEVGAMIRAFERMARSIQENVNVIRRVAEGDMTSFVNIRSSQDSLGKNLYRMVQSNDLLFNEIIQVAHVVASGSGEIARASQSLAESAGVQAAAVNALSSTVNHASDLISHSNDEAQSAQQMMKQIEKDATTSNQQMMELVESVKNIRVASERISSVIKSIDDIAFQTNILALNAAVEAARAGEAGKGFAVVADEVRNLANKSAEAAQETKLLIEDTIDRTAQGSTIAVSAADMFQNIIAEIGRIVETIQEMASSSQEQMVGIQQVNQQIGQIAEAASSNAAISEESAASSHEMSGNAEKLRRAMGKFTLRRRTQDRAYIPPEKQNDPDFIRQANEAFQKALETGRYGQEYIDPNGEKIETTFIDNK